MRRVFLVGGSSLLVAVAVGQIRPPAQDPRLPTRTPINLQSQRVKLMAASEPVGAAVDVKLRWIINEGWAPAGGFRLYRVEGIKKTRVFPPATPSAFKLSPAVAALRQSATMPFSGESKLFETNVARPVSSLPIFEARASKAVDLLKRPQINGRMLKEGLATLPTVTSFFNNLEAPSNAPRVQALSTPGAKVLDARRAILFSALASPASAEVLGFGATDEGLTSRQKVNYQLFEVGSDGKDGQTPVAQISDFVVGEDAMPPAPKNVRAVQVGEGEVELRWDRLSEADESSLGLALYDIRRYAGTEGITPSRPTLDRLSPTAPKDGGTHLTPQPVAIADLKAGNGFVEPFSFFTDKSAGHGRTTYSVVLVDGFGRRSAAGTVVVELEDLRVPSAPAPLGVELTGGGRRVQTKIQEAPNQPPIKVSWKADPDDTVRYYVYRKDTEGDAQPVKLTPAPIAGTAAGTRIVRTGKTAVSAPIRSFTDSTAELDRKYQYIIRSTYSFNSDRESSDAPTAVIDVPSFAKPGVPANLKVEAFKPSGVKTADLRSYTSNVGTFKGVDLSVGNPTNPLGIGTPGVTAPQLSLPKTLKPAVELGGSFTIRWNAIPGIREPLYRVFRQVKAQPATSMEVGTTKGVSYVDSLPRSQKVTYEYAVVCQSRWGVRGAKTAVFEAIAPATLPPASPSVLSVAPSADGNGITVSLQPNPDEDDIQVYRVLRKIVNRTQPLRPKITKIDRFRKSLSAPLALSPAQDPANDTGYELAGQVQPSGELKFVDAAANDPTKKYYYKVEAVNRLNMKSEKSDPLGAEVLKMSVPAPVGLAATPNSQGISLSWQASAGAKTYVVKRAPASGGEFTQVSGALTTTNFVDKSAVRGRRYKYVVVALDSFGNVSPPSAEAGPAKYP